MKTLADKTKKKCVYASNCVFDCEYVQEGSSMAVYEEGGEHIFDDKKNWVTPEPVVLQRNPEYICLI